MSQHLGTTNFLETPTVGGIDVLLNYAGVPGIGAGTTPPAFGTPGRLFFDTSANILWRDTGVAWVRESSPFIQMVTGSIAAASGTTLLPYDNTTPLSTEGNSGWSQSFTPLSATSNILIMTNSFFATNSNADIYTSGALFNGTTCFAAQLIGFTTSTGHGFNFSMMGGQPSGSTTARTYSFRYGPNAAATVYLGQGSTGQAFGLAGGTGRFYIMEIAA